MAERNGPTLIQRFEGLPIILAWLILGETLDVLMALASPIAELLPMEGIDAETEAQVVAVALLLALCILTGLAMRSKIGVAVGRWFERVFLQPLPGYPILKSITRRFAAYSLIRKSTNVS